MRFYPLLEINLSSIFHNARLIVKEALRYGINIDGVTKVTLGDSKIAKLLLKAGVRGISDSRIESIRKMKEEGINAEFTLLRLPSLSEIQEVLCWTEISLNSELKILEELNFYAERIKRKHKVIIMVEMGDLREGIWRKEELEYTIERVLKMNNIELFGIGTNFTCFGGVIPTEEKLKEFVEIVENLERKFSFSFPIISGGNSSSLPLLFEGKIPSRINHLRIGEAIMLGKDTAYRNPIRGGRTDTFKIYGEVIEVKEKPSVPWGVINESAFGYKPVFKNRGVRRRAILNLGRQDIDPNGLFPEIEGIEILSASSDHLILDLGEHEEIKVGDVLGFYLSYSSLLQAFTSPFVKKVYKEEDKI
ncbi:MAG: alanine/ornithine racemase family PLP-dependent enzyme [Dictyoglomaceae bacterium]|jgi:predicted amino acid racemase